MATPLRKDQPEFEDEGITTADLAQGRRPVSATPGPQVVAGSTTQGVETESAHLFPGEELQGLRTRWKEIQTGFVDEPRKAVEQADGLVASAMKRLAEVFAEERAGLEKQWDRGDSVSTEDLRVAMQRYRTFFERLLSV
jgi:hypothetical protein